MAGHPVLDVLGQCLIVRKMDILVLAGVVVGGLAGEYQFLWRRRQRQRWQREREGGSWR
jgi:hypothetical protein